jgi:hypothetical protein
MTRSRIELCSLLIKRLDRTIDLPCKSSSRHYVKFYKYTKPVEHIHQLKDS